jgi:hypothetical protein
MGRLNCVGGESVGDRGKEGGGVFSELIRILRRVDDGWNVRAKVSCLVTDGVGVEGLD